MKFFSIIAIVAVISLSINVYAEETTQAPAQATQETSSGNMGQGMMKGKMDMDHMHNMMGECMKSHNDQKMCDEQVMGQCEQEMNKGQCMKMMKKAKGMMKGKNKK